VADTAVRHASIRPALDDVSQRAVDERAQSGPAGSALGTDSGHAGSAGNSLGDDRNAPETILWAALSMAPEDGISVSGLMSATGMGRRWVYYRLREVADAGRAVQTDRGNWRALDQGGDAR
jgi:hypothetical protein